MNTKKINELKRKVSKGDVISQQEAHEILHALIHTRNIVNHSEIILSIIKMNTVQIAPYTVFDSIVRVRNKLKDLL